MSSIAAFSVDLSPASLRLRLWACYAVVALFWLIAVASRLAVQDDLSFPFLATIWVGLLPLADVVSVRLRRIARGRSLFGTDYRHLHHYLLAKGWSRPATLFFLVAIAALLATAGYFSWYFALPAEALFVVALAGIVAFHAWMWSAWRQLAGFRVLITQ